MTTDAVVEFAARLEQPTETSEPWEGQSLSHGAAGVALLHLERARTGHAPWSAAHRWIHHAVAGQLSAADTTGLFFGAPAVAFVLSAAPDRSPAYADARRLLHSHVTDIANRRVDAAQARVAAGTRPNFTEYDVLYGLTGIGA